MGKRGYHAAYGPCPAKVSAGLGSIVPLLEEGVHDTWETKTLAATTY